jgi:hypothetical protein
MYRKGFNAGGLLLTAAIEESGSLDGKLVAERLSRIRKRTVYGGTAFDSNRQNNLRFVTVRLPTK